MLAPGTSPRLMSPTEESRSGLTVTATGSEPASACSARARTITVPGAAATRPLSRNSPAAPAAPRPALCQSPSADRVSSSSGAPGCAPVPCREIRPPGATSVSDGLAARELPAEMGLACSEPTEETRKSSIASAEPSVVSAATAAPGGGPAGWGRGFRGRGAGGGGGGGSVGRKRGVGRRRRLDLGYRLFSSRRLRLGLHRRCRQHGGRGVRLLDLRELARHGGERPERLIARLGGLLGRGPGTTASRRRLGAEADALVRDLFVHCHGVAPRTHPGVAAVRSPFAGRARRPPHWARACE